MLGVIKLACQRGIEEYSTEGSVVTPTVYNNNWSKKLEDVEEYLPTFRGVNITPLSYVAIEQLVNMDEEDHSFNE